jgi:hypothetical protein
LWGQALTADALARSADQLKKSLDKDLKKDSTVEESTRESIVREADMLSDDAKALADRVKDGKPSSAEADRVMERAAKLKAFINAHQTPAASAAWAAITSPVQMLADAYRRRRCRPHGERRRTRLGRFGCHARPAGRDFSPASELRTAHPPPGGTDVLPCGRRRRKGVPRSGSQPHSARNIGRSTA